MEDFSFCHGQMGMVYRSCVRSAMLYGSKIWCLRENATRERESNGESNVWCKTDGEKENRGPYRDVRIQRFRWQRPRVRWYWHVLRSDDGHVLRKALEFEVRGKRKQGRPMKTWKTQVENKSRSIGLKKKGTMDGARWREGVREIAAGQIRPPPFTVLNLP